ncbi:MAG: hypothetical protein ACRDZ4_17995 [Egibacteraceae bacterium]
MDRVEPGSLTDRADPPVRGPAFQALTIAASQDRTLVTLAHGEADRPGGASLAHSQSIEPE